MTRDSLGDLLTASDARVDGNHMTIKFPLGQLIGLALSVVLACGFVVGSVWLTTKDLGRQIGTLASAVQGLTESQAALISSQNLMSGELIGLKGKVETHHRLPHAYDRPYGRTGEHGPGGAGH